MSLVVSSEPGIPQKGFSLTPWKDTLISIAINRLEVLSNYKVVGRIREHEGCCHRVVIIPRSPPVSDNNH